MSTIDDGAPTEWKKYSTYACKVDPDQDDRSTEVKLFDFSRPHMRAFHCCWWCFFMAFIIWFAIAPLLPEIKATLGLTKQQVWTTNIIGVGGTIFMRFLLGPLCDKYGGRLLMSAVLCFAAIPTACLGLVQDYRGLCILRLFIGVAGGTFVMCQYWCTDMFAKETVGTANATAAGWGNLGGGVTQLFMGSMLFPLFKNMYNGDPEKAWRRVCIVPAILSFTSGMISYNVTDDCPKGNYSELKKYGVIKEKSAAVSFRQGAVNVNTWLLFWQYAACFGVELTMNNAAASYFKDVFGLTTEKAAAIASLFGWMNLFARGLGGVLNDYFFAKMGMKGRILSHLIMLMSEGVMVLIFAKTNSLSGAIFVLVIFSLFVQAAEGTTFGIVPYVDPPATGAISGIVGAGGNVGAVGFGLCFRQLEYDKAFTIMGLIVLGSGVACMVMVLKGHRGLLWGEDVIIIKKEQTILVPEKNKDNDSDDEEA